MGLTKKRRVSWKLVIGVLLSVIILAGLVLYGWIFADLPSPDNLERYTSAPSSKVYDRHGRLLFEIPPAYAGNYTPVPLSEIPLALRQATIAAEDRNYYEHPGVDVKGVLRAVWWTVFKGQETSPGGSTITQQLARNLLMTPEERQERSLRRKLREMVLAIEITQKYSKDKILELYLNQIYYGNLAYGVEAAAQTYFGKHVRDLDLAECAMLTAIPQSPALYNPLTNPEGAAKRQAVVLGFMVETGDLTEEQARLAREEKLYFASSPFSIRAPHFVMEVRRQLELTLGQARLDAGGLEITTTLDLDLNETARDIVRNHLEQLAICRGDPDCQPGGHNVRNGALVAMDPRTGEVLAMLGSPDYFSTRISGAVNGAMALRQPGSAVKPLTYATALTKKAITPATMMLDVRTSFVTKEGDSYVPLNYDLQFRGPVRMREALASSYNLIAVKVLDKVGLPALLEQSRAMGITTWDDSDRLGLAVTLGGGEVRLLELTGAYAVFANGGRAVQPIMIRSVTDTSGRELWPAQQGLGETVLDERVVYLITDMLSDDTARLPTFGEGSVLKLTRPAAVKTGTTTDFRDNWTVGYTPDLVVGVWTGNADAEPMRDVSGVSGAAPIWHDFMEMAQRGKPELQFIRPDGLEEAEVCALSGELPGPDCPHRVKELFLPGTVPTQTCTMHEKIAVDVRTGLRAGPETSSEWVTERTFVILPPEAEDWAREQGWPEVPPVLDAAAGAETGARVVLESPDRGSAYRIDPSLPLDMQRLPVTARVDGVTGPVTVTLWLDGGELATLTASPYRIWWPLAVGVHHFYAEAQLPDGTVLRSEETAIRVEP